MRSWPAARFRYMVAAACVSCAALGAFRIGSQSLWFDELYSIEKASHSWSGLVEAVRHREVPSALHHVLLFGWVRVFGDSEAAARSLSVVVGIATVALLMVLTRRLFSERAAVFAAALFLVQGYTIHYLQEARTYSLAILAAVVTTLLFVRALEPPGETRRWAVYGAVAGLSLYAHLFLVFVLAAHVFSLVGRRRVAGIFKLAVAMAAFLVVASPILFFTTRGKSNIDWIPATTGKAVTSALAVIVVGGGSAWLVLIPAALWALLLVRRRHRAASWPVVLVGLWVACPFVLGVIASIFKPVFMSYYLVVAIPAVAMLTAAAVDQLPRSARWVALAAVLAVQSVSLVHWYQGHPKKEDFRSAIAFACTVATSDATLVYEPSYIAAPAGYYLPKRCKANPAASGAVPDAAGEHVVLVARQGSPPAPSTAWTKTSQRRFAGVTVATLSRHAR